jgi:hypothetical protein
MIRLMRLFTFPRTTTLVFAVCAGILCCYHANAESDGIISYSGRDVTGGLVVRIEGGDLTIRERNGKERNFEQLNGEDRTSVKVDDRNATLNDIKVGMRVQIVFYNRINGTRRKGTDDDALPMSSIKAQSNSPEKPKS